MSTITNFPDGSVFTTNAQLPSAVQTQLQLLSAQILGILMSALNLHITTTSGLATALVDNSNLLYSGVKVTATGIPDNTTILSISGLEIILSNNATSSVDDEPAVAQDLNAPSTIKTGWAQVGQPGPDISIDSVTIIAETIDTPYSRIRDGVYSGSGETILYTDTYTRTWMGKWIFYGPNASLHALQIKSALSTVGFVDSVLAQINFYVNPDIEEPKRLKEPFQGQNWERCDLRVEFNEQVTDTLTVGTVGSVEVEVYTKAGKLADFVVDE